MRHPDSVMIFAAGFGTRMGALTADRPKPMVPVAGRPMIDHALGWAKEAGLSRQVVNTHYKAEILEAHLEAHWPDASATRETPDILDTGGGLKAALPMLGPDPVYTMNSDAFWIGGNPFDALAAVWDPDRMDALLLLSPLAQNRAHQGSGDFLMATDGRLTRGPGLTYTGAQITRTAALAEETDPVFSLNVLWQKYASSGRLYGVAYEGLWCDAGHPDGVAEATALITDV